MLLTLLSVLACLFSAALGAPTSTDLALRAPASTDLVGSHKELMPTVDDSKALSIVGRPYKLNYEFMLWMLVYESYSHPDQVDSMMSTTELLPQEMNMRDCCVATATVQFRVSRDEAGKELTITMDCGEKHSQNGEDCSDEVYQAGVKKINDSVDWNVSNDPWG
ncbi:uncharacterized protein L969DRAFT_95061 [Mixia osmundae IAM 14324]|uniref:uncharacterized protein n=1 Tax=Mixia osmundae (strain CBS 9802 / IAM 14324 / JCM 22182 / KY 12970) TaxID=764103 RepID=UPI0004A54B76|nr:uncharacterized protein L969DRAFT_95061 [Mixia osmundae IAM 14324]KEI38894.1 hypothetical protein L969DRAFT_95061 [Mixia osmundae IAM 14324]